MLHSRTMQPNSSSRHLRHRNVDVGKRIRVFVAKGSIDRKMKKEAPSSAARSSTSGLSRSRSRSRSPASRIAAAAPAPADRLSVASGGSNSSSPERKAVEIIPTPEVRTVDNIVRVTVEPQDGGMSGGEPSKQQNSTSPPVFQLPEHYIHIHLTPASGILSVAEHYDLQFDDMTWCKERSAKLESGGQELTLDDMELLIDLFEKKAGAKTKSFDCESVFGLANACRVASADLNLHGRRVEDVYLYWISKRRRLGKSLMRIFQEPAPHDDPSPHVAFRTRENLRRISTRNPRKNDDLSFSKMRVLRRDLAGIQNLLNYVKKRESLKKQRLLLSAEIFDKKLATSTAWGREWAGARNVDTRIAFDQRLEKLITSNLSRSTYEQDILLTRLKARKKRTSLVPKRARPRPHVDTVVRPRLHTSLFQRKFPEPSALSSASDSSEAETEAEALMYDQVEQHLADSQTLQKRRRPPRSRSFDACSDYIGQLIVRYGREHRIVLDRIIFDRHTPRAPPQPGVSGSAQLGTGAVANIRAALSERRTQPPDGASSAHVC